MKYAGMPFGMWILFTGSFREHLTSVYGYDPETAGAVSPAWALPAVVICRIIISVLISNMTVKRFKLE